MTTKTFADLGLSAKVIQAIEAAGYTTPTPIQAEAIPVAVTGQDVLGIAQTGTGKTASFVLPMITRLETGRARARMPRSLILAPTRELAAQVEQSFDKYGINHKLTVALLIGGVSFEDQVRKLDRGVDVLIATPGRMLDHFQRGKLLLTGVEILVIDEADRMLDMGFIPDIERICKLLPANRQTLFFSATMPPEIQRLVASFLKDPIKIEVARPATTAETITQRFQFCPDGEDWAKRDALRDLIRSMPVKNAIIFCNRKRDVAILHKSLQKHGFNAGALHGDMDQSARSATLDEFRAGKLTLLAASDVAARGLDIPDVSHIFNFDVPWASDDYVHRIGRTGRAGREGFAMTLVTHDDLKAVRDIEKNNGVPIIWVGEPPTEDDYANSGKRRRGRGATGSRGAVSGRSTGSDRVASPARPAGSSRGEGRSGGGYRDTGRGRGQARGEGQGEARGEARGVGRGEGRNRAPNASPASNRAGAVLPAGREGHPTRVRVPYRDIGVGAAAMDAPIASRPGPAVSPPAISAQIADTPQRSRRPALATAPGLGEQPHVSGHGPALKPETRDLLASEPGQRSERAPRPERGDARPERAARSDRGYRSDRRPRAGGAERALGPTTDHAGRAEPHRERHGDGGNGPKEKAVGFADNVPAFLRRPPRTVGP